MNIFHTSKKENIDKPKVENNIEDREWEKGIIIHTMPQRFRIDHVGANQAQKVGLIIIAGGALLLLVILALAYFFIFKNQKENKLVPINEPGKIATSSQVEKIITVPVVETAPEPSVAAQDVYINMIKAIGAANNYNDYANIIRKYGSQQRLAELEEESEKINQLANGKKDEYFKLILESVPRTEQIKEVQESIEVASAILNVVIKDTEKILPIELVLVDNEWKVFKAENLPLIADGQPITLAVWLEKSLLESAMPKNFKAGQDSDQDGLTDKEEELLLTKPDTNDSDGDGYQDLSEFMNFYNPAGSGRLDANAGLKKYDNEIYNYNTLYPAGWAVNKIGGDESIIFKSADNQFIQIMVQANANKQPIDQWYNSEIGPAAKEPVVIAKNGWSGVKSEDGLILYLADSGLNNVYIITYNPAESDTLEYNNIFNMMIDNFKLSAEENNIIPGAPEGNMP